jgi:steroid 5-alpha reductase family enzyme
MGYIEIYFSGLLLVIAAMTLLWIVSLFAKNASIVDPFWGFGFVIAGIFYFYNSDGLQIRKLIVLILLIIWGLRLSIYLGWRNLGKVEDFRYQQFRKDYGAHRYWWVSFF